MPEFGATSSMPPYFHSKQRHNKLWRPGTDEESSDELQASGHSTGGEETPGLREDEAWGGCGASPCRGLEMEPLDCLNYNYYFRRLSDSALDSEPSTPVRGPPLLGMERVFIEIEDVERDALLEDEGFPMAHLALPGEGTAAQTCSRLDPLEDMRLRLEFSTLEEEDEEEAKKEEAEMAALAQTPANSEGRRGGGVEGCERMEESRLGLANLNTNNSNRLAAKRSCPAAFDVSGSREGVWEHILTFNCKINLTIKSRLTQNSILFPCPDDVLSRSSV